MGLSLPKSNLIFLKKCLDKWVHFSFLVCLETKITEELISKLAKLDPLPIKFIFRDSAFKDDIALKDETFRRLKALVEKNAGTNKSTYTVEFI